jgi:Ca2+-transporting ATPase
VGIFIASAFAGWPVPLTAVQLLVINLLGDSWLSIALATEKEEKDVMEKPPRPADEPVITQYMWFSIALQSVIATIVMMIAFLVARDETRALGLADDSTKALAIQQTAVFIAFMVQKILRSAFTARSLKSNLWEIGFFTNKWSLLAAVVSAGIAALAIYVFPVGMTDIPSSLWPILLGIGLVPAIVEEVVKFILKFTNKPTPVPTPAKA